MSQKPTVDQYIESLKKGRKRSMFLMALWSICLLLDYFALSNSKLFVLMIAVFSLNIAISAANCISQDRLITVLKLLKENPLLPSNTTENTAP
ncbi:hypothetical protein [Gimesia panareensis]|uniref:hypothetical protein n=1 Tax=Gimesia panareensis TaxID=2527978 RepID=UPI00118BD19A|nr:hypothetical protein [Gimesia panareensis]QDU52913.1 hypothetical protein Pan110_52950 [Gimesia panareensis]